MSQDKIIEVNDLTLVVNSSENISQQIAEKWNVLCDETNLSLAYKFAEGETEIEGYILNINGRKEIIDITNENKAGAFISYSELDSFLNRFDKSDQFKDCMYQLIDYLYKNSR